MDDIKARAKDVVRYEAFGDAGGVIEELVAQLEKAEAERDDALARIAGHTSVTREQLADAIEGAHKAWHEYWGDFNAGIGDDPGPLADFQADAILALLNGENDEV